MIWGGVEAPNTMWFAAIPIVSVLVGGIRHGFIWGCISVASVLGNFGSDQRFDHTCIGPMVNAAAGIESQCPPARS